MHFHVITSRKIALLRVVVSDMTYTVSSGTLNPSIPYHTIPRKIAHCHDWRCATHFHRASLQARVAIYVFLLTSEHQYSTYTHFLNELKYIPLTTGYLTIGCNPDPVIWIINPDQCRK